MNSGVVRLLPTASVCLAEGAWIAVVAAAATALGAPAFPGGAWLLALLVAAGLIVARRSHGHPGQGRLPRLAWLGVAGGAFGLGALALGPTAAVVPASCGAFATWRGTQHDDPAHDDAVASAVLRVGIVGLGIPWLVGASATGQLRDAFVADALAWTLVFVAASLAGIALNRLAALGRESGLDWTTNRAWLLLLGGILLGLAAIAVPAALVLGAPLGAAIRGILGPVGLLVDAGASAIHALVEAAGAGVGAVPPPGPTAPADTGGLTWPEWLPTAVSAALLVAFAGAIAFVAAKVRGTPRDAQGPAAPRVERAIEVRRPHLHLPGRPHLHLPRRPREPRTVTAAYLAAIRHVGASPTLGRAAAETPRRHARRVGHEIGWRLGLLAADYELEQYARQTVTAPERRRAIARAAWVRRR